MQGAGGEVCADEAADVYVVELDVTVEALLLVDSPAVLSLGQLCDHDGFNFHWLSRQPAYLERNGKIFHCQPIHDVPCISSAVTPPPVNRDKAETSDEGVSGGTYYFRGDGSRTYN